MQGKTGKREREVIRETQKKDATQKPPLMRSIKIIEKQTVGKHNLETCEDGIVATGSHVAVIDGSTSKAAVQLKPTMHNGRLAMMLVSEVVEHLSPTATYKEFCDLVTHHIHACYVRHHLSSEHLIAHPEERLTASVAVYSLYHEEVWLVGDCQCHVGGEIYDNPKPEEERIARKRSAIIKQMLCEGKADLAMLQRHDLGRDVIVGEIVQTCHSQNVLFSVADGFPITMQHVRRIDVSGADEVVLATDGYPFLHSTLEASEAALAAQLRDDPLCIHHFLATKGMMQGNVSFDDRAFVRFRLD